jgi:hypothetical protein
MPPPSAVEAVSPQSRLSSQQTLQLQRAVATALPASLGLNAIGGEDDTSFADLVNSLNPSATDGLNALDDQDQVTVNQTETDNEALSFPNPADQLLGRLQAQGVAPSNKSKNDDTTVSTTGKVTKAESVDPETEEALRLLDMFNPNTMGMQGNPTQPNNAYPYWMGQVQNQGMLQQLLQQTGSGGASLQGTAKGSGLLGGMASGLTPDMLEKIQAAHKSSMPLRINLNDDDSLILKLARGKVSAEFVSSTLAGSQSLKQGLKELHAQMEQQQLPVESLEARYQQRQDAEDTPDP